MGSPRSLAAVAITVDSRAEIPEAIELAREAVRAGARLVEWRVDSLAEEGEDDAHAQGKPDSKEATAVAALTAIRRLVGESPAPCIVTIRSAAEGGAYRGDDADRISLLEALGTGEPAPRYIDLELSAFQRSANVRQKVLLAVDHARQPRDLKTSLILSSHDFTGRPADLSSRAAAMMAEPACAVAKLVWRARSVRDNLEAFELLRHRSKPMVALCMGEFGLMSRVLAPKFGGLFTFVRPDGEIGTAPGQPAVSDLFRRWRYGEISPTTRVYGAVGWPLAHSLSPLVHNAGFGAMSFDGVYLPLPVEGSWESFKATVGAMVDDESLDLGGLSVTLPHKEHLVRFVQERGGTLDETSRLCGGANTLVVTRGGDAASGPALHAANTDAPAAVEALAAGMGVAPPTLASMRIAVIGAGGAARGVAAGLVQRRCRVVVVNRTRSRADALARELNAAMASSRIVQAAPAIMVMSPDQIAGTGFDAIINCTSVGMEGGPDPRGLPIPVEAISSISPNMAVMDAVYRPRETPLLARATAAGARTIDGLGMLAGQAEMAFRMWTGAAPPPGLFERLLREELP